jgi:hypothetical protein
MPQDGKTCGPVSRLSGAMTGVPDVCPGSGAAGCPALPARTVPSRGRPPRGERRLNGEGGPVVARRDLHHGHHGGVFRLRGVGGRTGPGTRTGRRSEPGRACDGRSVRGSGRRPAGGAGRLPTVVAGCVTAVSGRGPHRAGGVLVLRPCDWSGSITSPSEARKSVMTGVDIGRCRGYGFSRSLERSQGPADMNCRAAVPAVAVRRTVRWWSSGARAVAGRRRG